MRKFLVLTLIFVSLANICYGQSVVTDSNLSDEICNVLGLPSGTDLTPQHLATLTGTLSLNGKNIGSLEGLQYAVNLKTIYAMGNQISSLPTDIGDMVSLEKLFLSNNQISSIPTSISGCTSLFYLSLSRNNLTSVPDEIGSITNLRDLYLSYNQLVTLPSTIGNLSNLETLSLTDNLITSLPSTIGNLSNLEDLGLMNNQLTELPDEVGNLSSMYSFSLANNQLTILPSGVCNWTGLGGFFATDNLWGVEFYCSQLPQIKKNNNLHNCQYWDHPRLGKGGTNLNDFAAIKSKFTLSNCDATNNWGDGCDLNYDGTVDMADIFLFHDAWLRHLPKIPDPNTLNLEGNNDGFFAFTGANDFSFTLPEDFETENYSYSCFFRVGDLQSLMSLMLVGSAADGYQCIAVDNGKVKMHSQTPDGVDSLTCSEDLELNRWYQVTVVRWATANKMYLYLNGVLKAEMGLTNRVASYGTTKGIVLGSFNSGYYFNGEVYNARLWNYALKSSEIRDAYLMNSPLIGLKAYYRLDNSVGTVVDEMGFYPATNYGAARNIAGIDGTCFDFDGTASYVEGGNTFSDEAQFSISLWAYVGSFDTNQVLFSNGSLNDAGSIAFYLGDTPGTFGLKGKWVSGTAFDARTVLPTNFTTGTWKNIAVVYNGGVLYTFVDGVEVNYSWIFDQKIGNVNNLLIGKGYDVGSNFDGLIDNVLIWDRGLTPSEVAQVYSDVATPAPAQAMMTGVMEPVNMSMASMSMSYESFAEPVYPQPVVVDFSQPLLKLEEMARESWIAGDIESAIEFDSLAEDLNDFSKQIEGKKEVR